MRTVSRAASSAPRVGTSSRTDCGAQPPSSTAASSPGPSSHGTGPVRDRGAPGGLSSAEAPVVLPVMLPVMLR